MLRLVPFLILAAARGACSKDAGTSQKGVNTAAAPLNLARYLAARHAVVSQRDGMQGCLGSQLSAAGYEVNAVVAVPDDLTALAAVAAGPLVLTLPHPIASRYAAMFRLVVSPAPVVLELPSVSMTWSTSTEGDPSLEWLRQQVLDIVTQHGLASAMCDQSG